MVVSLEYCDVRSLMYCNLEPKICLYVFLNGTFLLPRSGLRGKPRCQPCFPASVYVRCSQSPVVQVDTFLNMSLDFIHAFLLGFTSGLILVGTNFNILAIIVYSHVSAGVSCSSSCQQLGLQCSCFSRCGSPIPCIRILSLANHFSEYPPLRSQKPVQILFPSFLALTSV